MRLWVPEVFALSPKSVKLTSNCSKNCPSMQVLHSWDTRQEVPGCLLPSLPLVSRKVVDSPVLKILGLKLRVAVNQVQDFVKEGKSFQSIIFT